MWVQLTAVGEVGLHDVNTYLFALLDILCTLPPAPFESFTDLSTQLLGPLSGQFEVAKLHLYKY